MKKRVLAVALEQNIYDIIAPILQRDDFEVDRVPRAAPAIHLLLNVPFHALLVRHPLPDIPIQAFLDQLRDSHSQSRRSPLLLIINPEDKEIAEKLIGKGVNRFCTIQDSPEKIRDILARLLQVAPRIASRVVIRLESHVGERKSLLLCQTENISETGMLIKTNRRFPLKSRVHFEFILPGDREPLSGEAQVVRHTTPGRERIIGVGLCFLSFKGDGWERLKAFLRKREGKS